MLAVAREDLRDRVGIELQLAELAAAHPAPRVLRGRVDADEAHEDLAAGGLGLRTEPRVETLRPASECADDAAGRDVARMCQRVGGAGREELGQRERSWPSWLAAPIAARLLTPRYPIWSVSWT